MSELILVLPSKGRLSEPTFRYFEDAGLHLSQDRGSRGYRATLNGYDNISVLLMSAAEIASELMAGRAHLGITGWDLLREAYADAEAAVSTLDKLSFGRADVVVAVPRAWVDVSTMADIDEVAQAFHARHHRRLRVATKFVNLTRSFFGERGITDYRIIESASATERTPAAGEAELIVDITTTGKTLEDNHLKTLKDGLILESQARLTASRRAIWSAGTYGAAEALLNRIAARRAAKSSQIIRVRVDRHLEKALPQLEAMLKVHVLSRPAVGNLSGEAALLVPEGNVVAAVTALRGAGVSGAISAQSVEYVFLPDNPLVSALPRIPPPA